MPRVSRQPSGRYNFEVDPRFLENMCTTVVNCRTKRIENQCQFAKKKKKVYCVVTFSKFTKTLRLNFKELPHFLYNL